MIKALDAPMLKTFMIARSAAEVPLELTSSAVVLGNLDGLHLGHQQLLKAAHSLARPLKIPTIVFTFDPHPMQVLPGKPDFKRIFPLPAQTQLLKQFGADGVYYQNFSAEFAKTTAQDFLDQMLNPLLKPKVIVVGFNFKFGQNRVGTPDFLKAWGAKNNVQVFVVDPFEVAGQAVSSSNIRAKITAGDVAGAGELLGFPFFVEGIVEKGAQRGRNLGFPTANVHWQSTLVPSYGVYVTRTHFKGNTYPSVSHLGPVPTFAEPKPRLETHILDQDLSLYGEDLKVEFLARLRDPVKFDGLESLKTQIQKDISSARQFHDKHQVLP